jgi:uncharacterized membrane protein
MRARPAKPLQVNRSLLVAMSAVVAVMTALACVRWSVWSYGSDTGTFAQAILNSGHGFTDAMENGSHLRFHWSPILALLWPLVVITRTPLSLQIAQVVLITLTALPLYAIVKRHAGEAWALRCAILTLIYPPLLANAFAEFHELAFFPVIALALVWAADRARWGWFAVFAVLAVTIREDVCLDLIFIGIALAIVALIRRSRPPAYAWLGLALLSAASLAVYVFAVLPHEGTWAPSHFYRYPFADGPLQTALAIFTHPLPLLHAVATRGRLTYLLEAFVPLAMLPLFTPWGWLALPAFVGILLSSDESVWRMGMHYVLLWAPWMLLAAAWALIKFASLAWWRTAIALCIVFLILFNPMHPAHYLAAEPYQHSADAQRAFACIPPGAPVETHDEWFSHEALAHPNATVFGNAPQRFNGYLVFASDWKNAHFAGLLPGIKAAENSGRLTLACRFGPIVVLRSKAVTSSRRVARRGDPAAPGLRPADSLCRAFRAARPTASDGRTESPGRARTRASARTRTAPAIRCLRR